MGCMLDWKCIGGFPTPSDVIHYTATVKGACGQCAIAAIQGISVADVFTVQGITEKEFKHYTSQKEMRRILEIFGYVVKQKRIKTGNKQELPVSRLAIVRVSFANPESHWMEIAKKSHYIALKQFPSGFRYVFDNIIKLNEEETNGLWIEAGEYRKVMANEKFYITSYLDLHSPENHKGNEKVIE